VGVVPVATAMGKAGVMRLGYIDQLDRTEWESGGHEVGVSINLTETESRS